MLALTHANFQYNVTTSPLHSFVIFCCIGSTYETRPDNFFFPATFDVCDINVSSTANSKLDYSVVFVGDSNALGVLIILLFRTGGLTDFNQSIYFVQGRTRAETTNQLSGISSGTYLLLAYDVEENGEVTSNLAAVEEEITVTGQTTSM